MGCHCASISYQRQLGLHKLPMHLSYWITMKYFSADLESSIPKPSNENSFSYRLTHLRLDEVAAILADGIFNWNFFNEKDGIPIQSSLKFVSRSSIDKPVLVQVMVWREKRAPNRRQAITGTNDDAFEMSYIWIANKKYQENIQNHMSIIRLYALLYIHSMKLWSVITLQNP